MVTTDTGVPGNVGAPAGWLLLTSSHATTVWAKPAGAAEPATYTFTQAAGSLAGVVLNYGAGSVPSPAVSAFAGTPTQQAPASTAFQNNDVVIEVFSTVGQVNLTITTNVNSPTTRASFNNGAFGGSFLVVDYRQATAGATTGDTGGTDAANDVAGSTCPIGT